MHDLQLYSRLLGASVRAQWRYRLNAVMRAAASCLLNITDFIAIWALVSRFGPLKGWSLAEMAVLYGSVNAALASSQIIARGYDTFDGIIRHGEFDRVLLRPRSVALQLLARDLPLNQLGRLLQAVVVLIWGLGAAPESVSAAGLLLLVLAIAGAICVFNAVAVIQATACFWTVEGLEVFNVLTYGGGYVAEYPLTCYRPVVRALVLYVVPITLVTYPPCLWLLGRSHAEGWSGWTCWCAPLAGVASLLLASLAWRLGVRRYASTGS
jgi:ABC-2 type transport system permease protein